MVSALHATQKHSDWVQCNNTISNQMWSPKSRPSIELLPDLLKQMPIILYAGELDLMCNYVGLEASIDHLSWNGSSGMKVRLRPRRKAVFYGACPAYSLR